MPDFIGIGPARAGTTWLYENLRQHPRIAVAKWDKKTHFFDLYYQKGIDWYEAFYEDCPADCKKGEITETYLFHDEVPERIHRHYPDVKIFACLRNPVDRSFSAYMHLVRDGLTTDPFEKAIQTFEKILITDNLYYDRLKPYYDHFDKNQLYITLFEDIQQDPAGFLTKMYAFLGVDKNYLPPHYDAMHNRTEQPRFPLVNKLMLLAHLKLRDMDIYKYVLPFKNTKFIQKLRFKEQGEGHQVGLSPDIRNRLHETFDPQVRNLADLIERDLSAWLKPDLERQGKNG